MTEYAVHNSSTCKGLMLGWDKPGHCWLQAKSRGSSSVVKRMIYSLEHYCTAVNGSRKCNLDFMLWMFA